MNYVNIQAFNSVITVYLAGFVVSLLKSIQSLTALQRLKDHQDTDLLTKIPRLKFYIFSKPLLWPYYFCIEKNR